VWFGADLQDCGADGELAAGREVGGAEVEVDVELVAGQQPPVAWPGEQGHHSCVHDGDLFGRVGVAVKPVVANEPGGGVQTRFGEEFALIFGWAPNDELYRAGVGG
jgi:hypothetical protein